MSASQLTDEARATVDKSNEDDISRQATDIEQPESDHCQQAADDAQSRKRRSESPQMNPTSPILVSDSPSSPVDDDLFGPPPVRFAPRARRSALPDASAPIPSIISGSPPYQEPRWPKFPALSNYTDINSIPSLITMPLAPPTCRPPPQRMLPDCQFRRRDSFPFPRTGRIPYYGPMIRSNWAAGGEGIKPVYYGLEEEIKKNLDRIMVLEQKANDWENKYHIVQNKLVEALADNHELQQRIVEQVEKIEQQRGTFKKAEEMARLEIVQLNALLELKAKEQEGKLAEAQEKIRHLEQQLETRQNSEKIQQEEEAMSLRLQLLQEVVEKKETLAADLQATIDKIKQERVDDKQKYKEIIAKNKELQDEVERMTRDKERQRQAVDDCVKKTLKEFQKNLANLTRN